MFRLHDPIDGSVREALREHDDLTAALLARRGMRTKEAADAFLAPDYDAHINDPLLIKNMEKAARRVAGAIRSGEKITVWSDYDCDGIPAGVLLHDFLKKAGANFDNYIPHRHEEGYGVNVPGIERVAKSGTKLVITADSGITDNEAAAKAKELGMDMIVTDHHLPGAELPDAYAVVDPKQEGETAPFRDYCGAGMAWKLCCAVLAVMPELREKIPLGWEKWLLDMAGLATIADMVPLTGENRVIAKYGLLVMRKSPRVGLQKLCRVIRVNQRFITEDDVGFMIAPRVNAASRMGDPKDAFRLFTTTDEAEAEALAKKLEAANRGRRSAAAAITRAAHAKLADRAAAGALPSVIALGDPDWRPALLGLVANGLMEEYGRPVFLWGREGNEALKGSCRSSTAHVVELMRATDAFEEFGGHSMSGGFTLKSEAMFDFEERLARGFAALPMREDEDAAQFADAELAPEEVTNSFLMRVERLAPYGQENPKPAFLLRDARLREVAWFGKAGEHLKVRIARDFDLLEGVAFFAKRELGAGALELKSGQAVSILANLEKDQFTRGQPVRLRILAIG
jgi:single-stranded-DNA-specific exonuclease